MEDLRQPLGVSKLDENKLWSHVYLTKPMKVFVTKFEHESQIKLFIKAFPDELEAIIDKSGTYLNSLYPEYPFTVRVGEYYVRDYENDKRHSLTQSELDSVFYPMPEKWIDPSIKE